MSKKNKVKLILNKRYTIGTVDKRLYGSFIEHMGRAVYTGIYEPEHPLADDQGFRSDVIETVKDMGVPIVRYPGGNFLSGYNWTDGIGPKEDRPSRLDLAWFTTESNQVGIDEFVDWCEKANTEVMAAVNLGTGTPQDAGYLVEYCNHPKGSYYSDLRIENGHEAPHKIKTWCLGNEMDGPWQICHLNAEDYGKKALETAKIMKWVDPSIELVACGSSGSEMPTFPEWDRTVLEYLYDHVDYISLHRYYELGEDKNVEDFLASYADMDHFIKSVCATADYVKAMKRSNKTLMLSFDEWNIWYLNGMAKANPLWREAPPLSEDDYTLLDALTLGGLLCTLVNNSDRVKIACLAQLINTLSPICTKPGGEVLKKATYYPFRLVSAYGRGVVLDTRIDTPQFMSKKYGSVNVIQSASVYDQDNGFINVFVLNCNQNEAIDLEFDFESFSNIEVVEHIIIDGSDLFAVNDFDNPHVIKPRNEAVDRKTDHKNIISIPKLSFNMIRFTCENGL